MIAQLLLAVSLLVFAAPALAQSQPSITPLVNPGFETCVNGSSPTGWQQGGTGNAGSPIVVCSTTRTHTGAFAARFVPFSVSGQGGRSTYVGELSQTVQFFEAGQQITLTYWVLFADVPQGVDSSSTGSYNFTVTYNNNADSRVNISPQVVPGTGDAANNFFYQFRADFIAPSSSGNSRRLLQANTTSGQLTIAFQSNQPSINIYIDDVSLTAPLIAGVSLATPLIAGDPSFVGLKGQEYQVHGIDGECYNLVSSTDTQLNARFVFLNDGACPVLDGIPAVNCWSHPGSYLGAIGLQQRVDGEVHTVVIEAGSAKEGFASVVVDGKELTESEYVAYTDAFNVTFDSSHQVTVQTDLFVFKFENSDMFINQAVRVRVPLSQLTSHGLFGQTHNAAVYRSALKYIEGEVDDYMINEGDLFGTDFVYNRFVSSASFFGR